MDIEFDFEKRYRLVREIIETVVLTVLMFMVIRLAVQNFNVDGHSMEPTLHNTELILVDKWSYLFRPPARGDVIVFVAPPQPNQDYVKRIIGLPGDIITIRNTTVYVNGVQLNEQYVAPVNQGNPYPSFTNLVVPPDAYFVMGDNRAGSYDSRAWGCVPAKNLIGEAALVYWPLGQDNNGLLRNESPVFAAVPRPSLAPGTSFTTCSIMTHPQPGATGNAFPANDVYDQSALMVLALPAIFAGFGRRRKPRRR